MHRHEGALARRYDARLASTPRSRPTCESLQDGTAGRHLQGGHTPSIEHQQSIAMAAPQDTGLLRERGDDVVDHLGFTARTTVLVHDVHAVAADEPDTKDYRLHGSAP